MRVVITGGAGFIGSNLVKYLLTETPHEILNYDNLTYAGNLSSLENLPAVDRHRFELGDIADARRVGEGFDNHQPDGVICTLRSSFPLLCHQSGF